MNRLRVKEIIAQHRQAILDMGLSESIMVQYNIADQCIPFEMTPKSKAQLLAKWNNGKALQKLTCEVLFKLRATLGCTYGELIGTPYTRIPEDCKDQRRLIKKWIQYEAECGNVLDAFVKLSHEYKCAIDFILLTEEESLMP